MSDAALGRPALSQQTCRLNKRTGRLSAWHRQGGRVGHHTPRPVHLQAAPEGSPALPALRQDLASGQLVAVLEVQNTTHASANTTAEYLSQSIISRLDPSPTTINICEAIGSQSRVRPDQPYVPVGAPAPAVARPLAAAAPAAAHARWSQPLNATLVVLNLTFASSADAAKVRPPLSDNRTYCFVCIYCMPL